jgi:hypothetical protein
MFYCLVDYWVCYYMFCSMGTKVFPIVAWPGMMDENVIDYCQSMSGCSGVAYPGLRMAGGIVTVWYQSLSSTLRLNG